MPDHRLPCAALVTALLLPAAPPAAAEQRTLSQVIAESFEASMDTPAEQRPAPGAATAPAQAAASELPQPHAAPSTAEPPSASNRPPRPEDFLPRLVDRQRLQPVAPVDPAMDCHTLYREATRLERLSQRYRPAFTDQPRNAVIGAAGLVVPVAFYAWGATAGAGLYEDAHRGEARDRLRETRRLMAERRCFARE